MKKIHTVVAVIGIAAAAGAAWWWQNHAASSSVKTPAGAAAGSAAASAAAPGGRGQGGPVLVEVARAEAITIAEDIQAVGSLKSRQGVMLRPEVSGRISRLGFIDGQNVKRGQLMVQLDDTLQRAQLQQAAAQAGIARTNLQRSRELLGQNFVSQSAVDQNAANLQVGEAQVALAEAQMARMKVLAPFDGTAGLRAVDVGDYVKDGADIVNIEDLSSLTVQFALPERALNRLRQGQAVEVAVDALPGRIFKGRVRAIDSQVDANGRAVQVLAEVENPGSVLRPGMFARPRVVFAQRQGAVVVPEEALVPQGAQQLLFKVIDGPNGQRVAQRLQARLGVRQAGKVEILEGVRAGDVLVTAGHARLLRGDAQPVREVDVARPSGASASAGADAGASAGASAPASRARPQP